MRSGTVPAGNLDASRPGPFLRRVIDFLAGLHGKRRYLFLAALALLFTFPSLWVGFAQDDFIFLSILKGSPGLEGLEEHFLNTFSFSEGDLDKNRIRMERGIMPWWGLEDWKVDLWRPLASLSHWLDYRLFGEQAWAMHLHSLLLYALLCVVAGTLYARFIPIPWAAALAGILFVIDGGHGIPAGWLSNRNALLAALFGMLALLAHDNWRRARTSSNGNGFLRHGIPACVWLGLALFGGESAVATGAYLFAYALFMDPLVLTGQPRARLRAFLSLAPYAAVVVAWRVLYSSLGHGVHGSWLYIDPIAEPLAFLTLGVQRFPVLLLGLFGMPDSLVWNALPAHWQYMYTGTAVIVLAWIAWCIRPFLRRHPAMPFWAVGAVLSAIPACATIPYDRLLMFSSIGAMGLAAQFLAYYVEDRGQRAAETQRRMRFAGALALFWICAHVFAAPPQLLATSFGIKFMDRVWTTANDSVPVKAEDAETRFIIINTPIDLLGAFLPPYRSANEQPVPKSWWWLCAGNQPVEVKRIDAYTLSLRPGGGFLQRPWAQIFRRPSAHPMEKGQTVRLSAMEAEVMEVSEDGRPLEVHFTFSQPLEASSFTWLTWSGSVYVPFDVPAPGETVVAPGLDTKLLLRSALGLPAARAGG